MFNVTSCNTIKGNKQGFTLVEVLVVVSLLSLLLMIYATSKPVLSQERAAALSIARTSELMDALYDAYLDTDANWADSCEIPNWWNDANLPTVNAFGQDYIFLDSQCGDRSIKFFQFVPKEWAGYVVNHLEASTQLTQAEVDVINGLDSPDANGTWVAIQTEIDIYGNLLGGVRFLRKQFESTANILGSNDRTSVTVGSTTATIMKPVCLGGKEAVDHIAQRACAVFSRSTRPHPIRLVRTPILKQIILDCGLKI